MSTRAESKGWSEANVIAAAVATALVAGAVWGFMMQPESRDALSKVVEDLVKSMH